MNSIQYLISNEISKLHVLCIKSEALSINESSDLDLRTEFNEFLKENIRDIKYCNKDRLLESTTKVLNHTKEIKKYIDVYLKKASCSYKPELEDALSTIKELEEYLNESVYTKGDHSEIIDSSSNDSNVVVSPKGTEVKEIISSDVVNINVNESNYPSPVMTRFEKMAGLSTDYIVNDSTDMLNDVRELYQVKDNYHLWYLMREVGQNINVLMQRTDVTKEHCNILSTAFAKVNTKEFSDFHLSVPILLEALEGIVAINEGCTQSRSDLSSLVLHEEQYRGIDINERECISPSALTKSLLLSDLSSLVLHEEQYRGIDINEREYVSPSAPTKSLLLSDLSSLVLHEEQYRGIDINERECISPSAPTKSLLLSDSSSLVLHEEYDSTVSSKQYEERDNLLTQLREETIVPGGATDLYNLQQLKVGESVSGVDSSSNNNVVALENVTKLEEGTDNFTIIDHSDESNLDDLNNIIYGDESNLDGFIVTENTPQQIETGDNVSTGYGIIGKMYYYVANWWA